MLKVKKIVDLSLELNENTPVYPGDPVPNITVATTVENDGYNLSNLYLGTQTGSHVDAPYHLSNSGNTIDKMDLTKFFGEAVIIRVTDKNPCEEITMEDMKPYLKKIIGKKIILFNTNWYKKAGTDEFFQHPYLSIEVAQYLINGGVEMICIDTLNADKSLGTEFPVHELFSDNNQMIGENMGYFDDIDFENPIIAVFPLKFIGLDGSPVRIVALDLEFTCCDK